MVLNVINILSQQDAIFSEYGVIVLRYATYCPQHAIIMYIYMTLTRRHMTFCLTVYDSVSSGNEIICGDIVFDISI